ncbi:MAG: HYR domain-containing protein, partial [Saprospiraceae bacterium]|nr:HYR domain-containing protein [Saprospiraceae bacterium]
MGETLTIEETGGDAVSWSWSSSGAAVIADPSAMVTTVTNVADGEIFTVTVTDANGCTSTCTTTAVVNAIPVAMASNSGPVCTGETVSLMETGGDAVAWSWSSNGTAAFNNPNIQNPQATGVVDGEIFTVIVTDVNGCTNSATTTITVNTLPVCSASNDGPICDGGTLTIEETGGDAVTWSWSTNGGATITDPSAASTTATGVSDGETFTVTITDANGCTSVCSTTAIVNPLPICEIDGDAAQCPDAMDVVYSAPAGMSTYAWSISGAGASIDGNDDEMTVTIDLGMSNATLGLTITDANGCTSSCSLEITILASPVCSINGSAAVCPGTNDGLYVGSAGMASYLWSVIAGDAVIDGPDDQQAVLVDFGTMSSTLQLEITDANGCTASCTYVVAVQDNTPPVFVNCPVAVMSGNDPSDCGALVNWSIPVAQDNCDSSLTLVQTMGPASGSFIPVNTPTTITYEATDDSGNTATCSFVVTVFDTEDPVAVCQNITIYLDGSGSETIVPADVDGGSSDNCGVATRAISAGAFDCDDVGSNNVTLTITDVNGNMASCVAEVTVLDTIPPDFTCPADMTVSGCVAEVPDLVSGLAGTDNCDNAAISFAQDPLPGVAFGPNAGDTIDVVITATDANGNTTTCTVTLTVVDDELPVFVSCPTNIFTCNEVDVCGARVNWSPPVAVDNCDDTLTVVQTLGPASGSVFPLGMTSIIYQVTDDDGNTATCSFDITVFDCQSPA